MPTTQTPQLFDVVHSVGLIVCINYDSQTIIEFKLPSAIILLHQLLYYCYISRPAIVLSAQPYHTYMYSNNYGVALFVVVNRTWMTALLESVCYLTKEVIKRCE